MKDLLLIIESLKKNILILSQRNDELEDEKQQLIKELEAKGLRGH